MTNMGMASVRKVHPHLFSDICVTEKGWRNLASPSLYARHELILMGASP